MGDIIPASNSGIIVWPRIITNCTPPPIVQHLHSSLATTSCTIWANQSYATNLWSSAPLSCVIIIVIIIIVPWSTACCAWLATAVTPKQIILCLLWHDTTASCYKKIYYFKCHYFAILQIPGCPACGIEINNAMTPTSYLLCIQSRA